LIDDGLAENFFNVGAARLERLNAVPSRGCRRLRENQQGSRTGKSRPERAARKGT
jgi:hypothetical protein